MTASLLDPDLLLAGEDTWRVEASRDDFLGLLLAHLRMLDVVEDIEVLWADELEARLWSAPLIPPWRADRAYAVPLVPVLYKYWSQLRPRVRVLALQNGECTLEPALECVCPMAAGFFLRLLQAAFERLPAICLGRANAEAASVTATSSHDGRSYAPYLIRTPRDWLVLAQIETTWWPGGRGDQHLLDKCLDLVRQRDFPGLGFVCRFACAPRFIDEVAAANERVAIASALVRRLTSTRQQAMADHRLHDELLSDGISRFRVDGGARIHYGYENDGTIVFMRYYDLGEHDDGL